MDAALLPSLTKFISIVSVASLLSVVLFLLHRRVVKPATLIRHQNLAEPTLSVVGTLFSVLLGFLISAAMNYYQITIEVVEREANCLCDIYALAKGLEQPYQDKLANLCKKYNSIVLDHEWGQMQFRQSNQEAWKIYRQLSQEVLAYNPHSDRENNIHANLMSSMQGLGECRRSRIAIMQHHSPTELWIVVIGGAAIVVYNMFFLVGKAWRVQGLLIVMVTVSICLNISLLAVYSFPFQGELKIRPEAFRLNQEMFKEGN